MVTSCALMREIISTCLSLEHALKVAYLGPEGTYTQAAVLKHFGGAVEPVASATIEDVFREVEARRCDYGVVPIENSVGGSISQTLDCLSTSSATVCGEVVLPIHHQFLSKADSLREVRRIYAHEQALAQCRGWLDRHLPGIERVAQASNAAAAQRAQHEPDAAAIASVEAGQRYELTALAANIEDYPHNTTRFVVLGRKIPKASGDDLTTVMFGVANQPGRAARPARCSRRTRLEHDPHRISPDPRQPVGVSLLRRYPRPCRGFGRRHRAVRDRIAGGVFQSDRQLPAGGALNCTIDLECFSGAIVTLTITSPSFCGIHCRHDACVRNV